jgi:hypothetical protein
MSGINETITHMYQFFNKELDAQLPEKVVFTLIPNKGRARYLGWFFSNRWKQGEDVIHEINIAPDFLDRKVEEIAETLIHEITHLKNNILNIKDCNHQQYHTKAFKKQAEAFGLKVERMKNRGYSLTSLGDDARKLVDAYKVNVLKGSNPFSIYRVSEVKIPKISTKKSVAIDQELAEDILKVQGGKLGSAVNHILREWAINQVK